MQQIGVLKRQEVVRYLQSSEGFPMRTTVQKITIVLAACGGLVLPVSSAAAAVPIAPAAVPSSAVALSAHGLALLRLGDRGPLVATWQARINGLVSGGVVAGPAVAEDGVFGPKTRSATLAVQARLNLAQDAVVGPRTRAAVAEAEARAGIPIGAGLRAESGVRVLAKGMRGEDVRTWQRTVNAAVRLGQLEHPRIAEDGVFGPRTRHATRALQTAANVRADGVVGPKTRTAVGWLLEGLPD